MYPNILNIKIKNRKIIKAALTTNGDGLGIHETSSGITSSGLKKAFNLYTTYISSSDKIGIAISNDLKVNIND